MGFEMQICAILRFSWSILVKKQNSNASSREENIPQMLTVLL